MKASGIERKLKELDKLEERLRQTANPSKVLLDGIKAEREALLNPSSLSFQGDLNDAPETTRKQVPKRR